MPEATSLVTVDRTPPKLPPKIERTAVPPPGMEAFASAMNMPRPDKLLAQALSGLSILDGNDFDHGSGQESLRAVDRATAALLAQFTSGLSPTSLMLAFTDWAMHLTAAPGKRTELVVKALRKMARFYANMAASSLDQSVGPAILPLPGDDRFRAGEWNASPYRWWVQAFLMQQQWWHNATHGVPGMDPHNQAVVSFIMRQMLDMFSPSNNLFTNPEVVKRTGETGGMNLVQGMRHAMEDLARKAANEPPMGAEAFMPGQTVAVTPGEVIFRNHLIEVIQYSPTTPNVKAEPVLIVPAWIMKYYILDLSPQNSMVRYLVEQGHTVFCISWRNVWEEERELGLDDYRRLGVMTAIDVVSGVVPGRKIHTVGYCLGGTILAITAATMARAKDDRLASITLFAAQTDFTEAGELQLFVDSSALYVLESVMWNQGYLSAGQMSGAFQMLRSSDLVWSRIVRENLMGERSPMNDLMAWNADATRMPYRMHSEYLRKLFLNNDLAAGRYEVDGRPISLMDLRVPMFVVGTERDHVAPWKSVFKIHQLTDTDITFVLTSGGHNAGIVSEPGRKRRHYRIHQTRPGELHPGPDEWVETHAEMEGSWWPAWQLWLTEHSASEPVSPPPMGIPGHPPLCPAPGTYVLQR